MEEAFLEVTRRILAAGGSAGAGGMKLKGTGKGGEQTAGGCC